MLYLWDIAKGKKWRHIFDSFCYDFSESFIYIYREERKKNFTWIWVVIFLDLHKFHERKFCYYFKTEHDYLFYLFFLQEAKECDGWYRFFSFLFFSIVKSEWSSDIFFICISLSSKWNFSIFQIQHTKIHFKEQNP